MMVSSARKAGVIGWPVAHSRSPLIHRYWLERYGVRGTYTHCPVAPAALDGFIAAMAQNGFVGANVTTPHKQAAARLVTVEDEASRLLGSVNTLYIGAGGTLCGMTTDGWGFLQALKTAAPPWRLEAARVVILGAGGAALSIIAALADQGVPRIAVVNRNKSRAEAAKRLFERQVSVRSWADVPELLTSCDLLINATALGMTGQPSLEIGLDKLPSAAVVADIVYVPLQTALWRAAKKRGLKVVDGLEMLLHQAVPGFEKWFGVTPVVTPDLRALVTRDLMRDNGGAAAPSA